MRLPVAAPFVFAFARHELEWAATDYGLWVTYKNLVAATGSLLAVPFLSTYLRLPDHLLAVIGASSGVVEYGMYTLLARPRQILIWTGESFQ